MVEVKHLAADLVGLCVYEGQLVSEVGEDVLGDGHADVFDPNDGHLDASLVGRRLQGVLDRLEEGLGQVQIAGAEVGRRKRIADDCLNLRIGQRSWCGDWTTIFVHLLF